MDIYLYVLIPIVIIGVFVISYIIWNRKKVMKNTVDTTEIQNLLNKDNIESIDFLRNKIVLTFKDISKFDPAALKVKGARSITIVGDKVKIYFEGTDVLNETIYKDLKNFIEG